MFLPNWSAKVDYLYYNLGRVNNGLTPLAFGFEGGVFPYSSAPFSWTRTSGNVVRAGIDYHFVWGAPAPRAFFETSSMREMVRGGRKYTTGPRREGGVARTYGLLAAPVYRRTLAARSHDPISGFVAAKIAQPNGS